MRTGFLQLTILQWDNITMNNKIKRVRKLKIKKKQKKKREKSLINPSCVKWLQGSCAGKTVVFLKGVNKMRKKVRICRWKIRSAKYLTPVTKIYVEEQVCCGVMEHAVVSIQEPTNVSVRITMEFLISDVPLRPQYL